MKTFENPGTREQGEDTIWSGRPALRSAFWTVSFWVVAAVLVASFVQGYTQDIAGKPPSGALAAVWLLLLMPALWRLLVLATTRYELTDRHLYLSEGVLNRRIDQLELHRVRDLSCEKPIAQRLLGLGTLWIHSVDRTTPKLPIKAQPHVVELQKALQEIVREEQKRVGYREFEST